MIIGTSWDVDYNATVKSNRVGKDGGTDEQKQGASNSEHLF